MNRLLVVASLLVVVWAIWNWGFRRPGGSVRAVPVDISTEPIQEDLGEPETVVVSRGDRTFRIQLTHSYEVSGHVLSAEHYDMTWTNDFFDVDVGLVWGERAADLMDRYQFHQNGRWLFWRSDEQVGDAERAYITSHVGNEHLIPAEGDRRIDNAIRWIDKGDEVRIKGFLVKILNSAWQEVARSSTRRTDSGAGACEIVYVTEVQIGDRLYAAAE